MVVEENDALLVQRSLSGDRDAFEALVVRYQKPMFNVALRIVHDYEDASEVTQAAFVSAFENLKHFKPRYKFYSWLYRITVNGSLNFAKGRRRFEGLDDGMVSIDKQPDELFSEKDTALIVEQALMKLPPDYRTVIVLSHFQDLSYKEIGNVLDIPEKTVKSRLFTARQLLKDILIGRGE
jgi:RNA polymerase sigma-70 factor (ECF subfamily)